MPIYMKYDGIDGAVMNSPSPHQEAGTRLALQRMGVSAVSAEQFLKGEIVSSPTDRIRLAQFTEHAVSYMTIKFGDLLVSS